MSKCISEKNSEFYLEDNGLCPSMYSFHSSPEEKHKLLFTLTQYGIETTVDRSAKKDRIRQWIQASIIEEEEEEEEEVEEMQNAIRLQNGNTSTNIKRIIASEEIKEKVEIISQNKKSNREERLSKFNKNQNLYITPIDPRIPFEQQKNKNQNFCTAKKTIKDGNTVSRDVIINDPLQVSNRIVPINYRGNEGKPSIPSGEETSYSQKRRNENLKSYPKKPLRLKSRLSKNESMQIYEHHK